jgi:hypothetical protein
MSAMRKLQGRRPRLASIPGRFAGFAIQPAFMRTGACFSTAIEGSNPMKMLGYALTAAVIAAAAPTTASAADLYDYDYPPRRAAYLPPPPPPPPPAYAYYYPRPYPYYAADPYWGPRWRHWHRPYWRAGYWGEGGRWGHRGWGRRW